MSYGYLPITAELDGYIRSVSLRENAILQRLREETEQLPENSMLTMAEQCQLMALLATAIGARRTIEVGVFTGYNTLWTALALPADGRILACDMSEQWTSIARRYWREAQVEHKIDLRLAPALQTLDEVLGQGGQGSFDLVYIDADKENYENYYERGLALLRPRGLVLIDNVLWSGKVADRSIDDIPDPDTAALRSFNAKLVTDGRIDLSMLTIGDGLTVACKR
ncbi:MAG TPA: class I SAM-dependent methyltransferase [Bryobacteraceae bacterium]|nr:class I SAM-dependent methyltransferase [Bryobacteraceae bacterium]